MTGMRDHFKRDTIRGKMSRLLLQLFIPVIFLFITIIAMIVTRNIMFASVSGNIAAASGFNQNFKDDVDLKMYLYVSGSSDEIPWDDVSSARNLAEELLGSTKNENSRCHSPSPSTITPRHASDKNRWWRRKDNCWRRYATVSGRHCADSTNAMRTMPWPSG